MTSAAAPRKRSLPTAMPTRLTHSSALARSSLGGVEQGWVGGWVGAVGGCGVWGVRWVWVQEGLWVGGRAQTEEQGHVGSPEATRVA
jgi:hypothetical protein